MEEYTNSMTLSCGCGVGHGGDDVGATAFGKTEAKLILPIVMETAAFLKRRGVVTYLTRTTNRNSSINTKVALFNSKKVTVCFDGHINAGGGKGAEVCYVPSSSRSKEIAQCVNQAITKYTEQNSRGLKARNDLGMLNYTNMPSFLVECGFIDNEEDLPFITGEKAQEKMGNAIAKGILDYLHVRWVLAYEITTTKDTALKSEPTSKSRTITVMKKNSRLTIYRLSKGGEWGYNGKGWVKLADTTEIES